MLQSRLLNTLATLKSQTALEEGYIALLVQVILHFMQYRFSKIQDQFRSFIQTLHVQHSKQRNNLYNLSSAAIILSS